MHSWDWQPAERDILRTIALRVRLLSANQVARGWFGSDADPGRAADQVLQRLEHAGLIARRVAEIHPTLEMRQPLFVWDVGKIAPSEDDFDHIATVARARWNQGHIPMDVFFATKETASLFGAFHDARHSRHCEATHDFHFSEVYLQYRQREPKLAARWLGEAAFPKLGFEIHRMKDPDAFIVSDLGVAERIVEFAGSYDADHLRAFHDHCSGGAADRLADKGWYPSDCSLARLYEPTGTSYEIW